MAVGYGSPAPLSLEGVGVNLLQGATLPAVTSNAWKAAPGGSPAMLDTLADPRPDAYDKIGHWGPVHDLAFLDRIHVLPRERDLGSVVSGQEIKVEVWNAYLSRAQILDDIVITGPAGIEVENPGGLPDHYPASESLIYVVKIAAEGDPQIDNLVTWEFDGLPSEGTAILLTGFRLIPFPFPPNMATPVIETFGYLTDVVQSFAGMEQRIQLRVVPVGTIAYSIFLEEIREAQMAGAILFGNQPRAFGVGRWQFQTALTAAAAEDDVAIYCSTADIPFEVGGLVMIWRSPFVWEVQTIESIAPDHVVITSGLRNAWPATITAILPAVVGRLGPDEAISWESLTAVSQKLTFDIDGFTP